MASLSVGLVAAALTGFPADAAESGLLNGAVLRGESFKTRLPQNSRIGRPFSSSWENWQMKVNVRVAAGVGWSSRTWLVGLSWSSAELASLVNHLLLQLAFPAGRSLSAALHTSLVSMVTAGQAPAS